MVTIINTWLRFENDGGRALGRFGALAETSDSVCLPHPVHLVKVYSFQ